MKGLVLYNYINAYTMSINSVCIVEKYTLAMLKKHLWWAKRAKLFSLLSLLTPSELGRKVWPISCTFDMCNCSFTQSLTAIKTLVVSCINSMKNNFRRPSMQQRNFWEVKRKKCKKGPHAEDFLVLKTNLEGKIRLLLPTFLFMPPPWSVLILATELTSSVH